MKKETEESAGAVLIVAPIGKDAALASDVLRQAGIAAQVCKDVADAAAQFGDGTSAILLAEEALDTSQLPALLGALKRQPAWSDVPVIILTSSGGGERMSLQAVDIFGPAGNVTLLERPLHGVTLVSAMNVALRARQRQFEVRELIEQRETVLTSISDAFSSIGYDWRYLYVNDRVAELAGVPKQDLLGRNIWEVFPEAVGGEFYQLAHQVMEERVAVQAEIFHVPWGRWLDTRIYPTKAGIVVFRADVTERKRQETLAAEREFKLRESEDLLRLATEAADIGTFDFYPQTGELRWSDRCKELFGLSPGAPATYETYLAGVHPDDRHIVRDTVQAVLQPDSTGRFDIEYRTVGIEDGVERWVAEKGRVVLDANGRAERFIGTILDITERKNAEIVLQRAKHEAEAANRAKDQFLAMLSHELRTPLTPVLMTIASLRRQHDLPDELQHDLEVLQRNVELEALLIDDLLDLTRIAHGKLELHNDAVDIHKALDHALNISNSDIQAKQLATIRHYNAAEHHCWADAARLQQVFWNLVKNAVKFTPLGGRLEIRTHNDSAHNIIVDVIDTGIGISAELLPRIFDAFEQGGRTTTSQYGGLGLGLAISKRVVDMHGGSLTAHSGGPGHGSTFTMRLAAMQTSMLDLPVTYLQDEPAASQPATILLVEDHADTARVLRRILEHAGFEVAHAGTVADARELAAGTRFDLVISDVGLPDGTGVDLMRFLHTHHRLSGIALSGFGTDEDVAASSAAGFAEHLTKPVDWPQLRSAIDRVLAGKARTRAPAAVS
jgi:PAS domain S-box-containing protein